MLFSDLIERALRLAASAHLGQCRKGSALPYFAHPSGVALLLARAGFHDEKVLAAAILHDVVEDTDWELEELAAEFPEDVISYVAALTERKQDENQQKRSWEDRKREHLDHAAGAPLEARAILLADKLHNLGSMVFDLDSGERIWGRFNAPRERLLWYYREMVSRAAGDDLELRELAQSCRKLIDRLESAEVE